MENVTLTIDGRQFSVPKGTTVLKAAIEAGIQVPYYCYHPGLGIDASCRVCLVKIEKMPKLQTSCSTPVAEGMVVHTQDAKPSTAAKACSSSSSSITRSIVRCATRAASARCRTSRTTSATTRAAWTFRAACSTARACGRRRFRTDADAQSQPLHPVHAVRRFMREVDGDAQIGIVDRGNGSEIATFNEQGVHSILSGNLMDVCPVGAITTRQYRFRSRPWDNPHAVDTICTLCAKGCSTTAWIKAKPEWAKGARLARVTPRYNAAGQRLLDVRHRALPVSRGSKASAPAQAADPDQGRRAPGRHLEGCARSRARSRDAAGRRDPAAVRLLASAHASHEELFLSSALPRHEGRRRHRARARHLAEIEKQQPAGSSSTCRRSTRRTSRARRISVRPFQRPLTAMPISGSANSRRSGPYRSALTSSIPAPMARLAMSAG